MQETGSIPGPGKFPGERTGYPLQQSMRSQESDIISGGTITTTKKLKTQKYSKIISVLKSRDKPIQYCKVISL